MRIEAFGVRLRFSAISNPYCLQFEQAIVRGPTYPDRYSEGPIRKALSQLPAKGVGK